MMSALIFEAMIFFHSDGPHPEPQINLLVVYISVRWSESLVSPLSA